MKLLNLKVGEVYIDGKNHPVFLTAFPKKSKKGDLYYEIKMPIFIKEVNPPKKQEYEL